MPTFMPDSGLILKPYFYRLPGKACATQQRLFTRVGKVFLKTSKLCALVWDSYEQIVDACCKAWNWFANDPARICSIGTRNWAWVNV
jgi:hypothetical protein